MKTVLQKLNENTEIPVTVDTQFVLDLSLLDTRKPYVLNLLFETQGVSAEVIGLYKLKKDQEINLTTISTHKVPNTSCVVNIKGVLMDKAKSSYAGKILIEKPAQQTSSFLNQNILVLGEETVNNSQPILEIEADDVKASHGSTTGRVDENIIYYLMSRGLDKSESETLIVEGFFESLLGTIVDGNVRNAVKKTLI